MLGDEREHVKSPEAWMEGLTVADVSEFVDADRQRWRQMKFHDGRVVQMLLNGPWLVLDPELDTAAPPPREKPQPGDVTVSPFPGGYLIGHMRDPLSAGIAWEYVAAEERMNAAIRTGSRLALRMGVRAWFQTDNGHFDRVPIGPPEA